MEPGGKVWGVQVSGMVTGIGVTMEALSNSHVSLKTSTIQLGLGAWRYAWARGREERRRGWAGLCLESRTWREGLLVSLGVRIKQENYENNRHSGASPTEDLPLYFLMNLWVFPQVVLNYSHHRLCNPVHALDICGVLCTRPYSHKALGQ